MRGGLRFMPESSGSSRWSGTPGTERRRWWSGLWGADCFGDLQRVRTAAKQLRIKLSYDADHPAYTFIEPSVGYRMEKGEGEQEQEERRCPSGLAFAEEQRR